MYSPVSCSVSYLMAKVRNTIFSPSVYCTFTPRTDWSLHVAESILSISSLPFNSFLSFSLHTRATFDTISQIFEELMAKSFPIASCIGSILFLKPVSSINVNGLPLVVTSSMHASFRTSGFIWILRSVVFGFFTMTVSIWCRCWSFNAGWNRILCWMFTLNMGHKKKKKKRKRNNKKKMLCGLEKYNRFVIRL